MKQKKENKPLGETTSNSSSEEQKKFEELKNRAVASTRQVRLFYHCSGNEFMREVPMDSLLKDGDIVGDHRLAGDKLTGRNMYGSGVKYNRDMRHHGDLGTQNR